MKKRLLAGTTVVTFSWGVLRCPRRLVVPRTKPAGACALSRLPSQPTSVQTDRPQFDEFVALRNSTAACGFRR